jgi:hypothetical protein
MDDSMICGNARLEWFYEQVPYGERLVSEFCGHCGGLAVGTVFSYKIEVPNEQGDSVLMIGQLL